MQFGVSAVVQVFGRRHGMPSTRSGDRRPKSAKAGNRGKWALAVPRMLWGFSRGFWVDEVGQDRLPRSVFCKASVSTLG